MIIEALKRTRGNMSRAAAELGLSERIMGLRVKNSVSTTENSALNPQPHPLPTPKAQE